MWRAGTSAAREALAFALSSHRQIRYRSRQNGPVVRRSRRNSAMLFQGGGSHMTGMRSIGLAAGLALAVLQIGGAPQAIAAEMKVLSEQTVKGFGHPEAVVYDPAAKVFYVGDF